MDKGSNINLGFLDKNDTDFYGSKAANLGELLNMGVPVPRGMVLTPNAQNYQYELARFFRPYGGNPAKELIVRSSGLAEDGDNSSYAGQHLTVPNCSIARFEELEQAITDCRASGVDAQAYRDAKHEEDKGIAVIIQTQINADYSGVLFTADPINNDLNTMICEWVNGMGNSLVSGEVNPDGSWEWQLGNTEPHNQTGGFDLDMIKCLHTYTQMILKRFRRPMDIEWVCKETSIMIVQARPLTMDKQWGGAMAGTSACKGIVTGNSQWLDDEDTTTIKHFSEGDILLAYMTTPKMVPAMIKAQGFATAIGGRTCHAAIVARELNKPCVVNVRTLLAAPNNQQVTIDGDAGTITIHG